MLRAIAVTAALAAAVTPYPKGAYKGQNKFLGQKIGAELTVKNSTHLDINLFGALGISCQDEPYTFADNQIKLTSTDPNDCLVKKLKKKQRGGDVRALRRGQERRHAQRRRAAARRCERAEDPLLARARF